MLQLTDIYKAFVTQTVLTGVSLEITAQSRIGLIGRNGCGKSTLLKIIMGEMEPDTGTIFRAPGLRVSCLTQEPKITPGNTLMQEVKQVFTAANALQTEETELLEQLSTCIDLDQQAKLLDRLDTVHREMARLEIGSIEGKVSRLLIGLGFSQAEFDRPVEQFSGGWQMRINLAKILLEEADILLLDEPTNHLDLEACEWLENFLSNYPGGIVMVSHDRHFLDRLVTDIAEIELGELFLWPGNYSEYVTNKALWLEQQTQAVERQEKELAKQSAFIERFRASATKSTQAKSREKQLQKVERLVAPKTNTTRMKIRFPLKQASGRQVLTLRNLSKAFAGPPLFQSVDSVLERQQRVFLLGANGCGKSTLFRLILGLESPDTGEVTLGHNVECGYFSQHQLETLDPTCSVFETIHRVRPEWDQTEVRNLLGLFLFRGDQVFKPVSMLSGGEKSKLALATLMLSGPNTLLLDEPTNHMDIPAKEVLEQAFLSFEGTMLCISHDRYFIQQLATEIWEIFEGQLLKYVGGYEYYLFKRDEMRARALAEKQAQLKKGQLKQTESKQTENREKLATQATPQLTPLKERRETEKQLTKVEKVILKIETALEQLQAEVQAPERQQDYEALQELSVQIGEHQAQLAQLNAEWEALAEVLSGGDD